MSAKIHNIMAERVLLVVEDEPLVRTDMRELLEEAGYTVREAPSADEALRLLESDGIDVVLTDIQMPGTYNGLDLAWMVRTFWPHIPVVVTSGEVLPDAIDLPANTPMLTKPFSRERLLKMVEAMA